MTPREQILSTAGRLFFMQGYVQTGINQIIAESGVAKRTFYHHFASKEELGAVHVALASAQWLAGLRAAAESKRTALGVVRGLFDYVQRFAVDTNYRGCGMANMAAEFADGSSRVRELVARAKQQQRELVAELLASAGAPAKLADQVHVLLEGAISGAASHVELWPIRTARAAAEQLVRDADRGEPT